MLAFISNGYSPIVFGHIFTNYDNLNVIFPMHKYKTECLKMNKGKIMEGERQ